MIRSWRIRFLLCVGIASAALAAWSWPDIKSKSKELVWRYSPKITQIEVRSDVPLNESDVIALSGLHPQMPLLFFSAKQAVQGILRHPEIKTAAISRKLTGEVLITVNMREPVAIVSGKRMSYVDEKGNIFKFLQAMDSRDYPVITGVPDDWNMMNRDRREIIAKAVELIALVNQELAPVNQVVSEVHVETGEGYSVYTSQIGGAIIFGLPPFAPRVQRLQAILQRLDDKLMDIETIDLDYNNKAFVRFRHRENLSLALKGSIE